VREQTQHLALRNQELAERTDDLVRTQSELVRAERMAQLSVVVSGIAHELQNPLNFIRGNLGPLRRYCRYLADNAGTAEIRAYSRTKDLDFVRRDVEQVLDDVADGVERTQLILSDLGHLHAGSHRSLEEVDLEDVVRRSLRVLSARVTAHRVEVEIATPLPRISARAGEVDQVLLNLLDNAVRALPAANGRLRVEVRAEDQEIFVMVEDDGVGMSRETLARACEPFFTTRRAGEGSGLGLAIVSSILASHRGRLSLDSKPGQGTRAEVRLPIARLAQ
jgi:hypothetical protein